MVKKMMRTLLAAALALTAAAASAGAGIGVANVWIRATVPGQKVAAAYLDITSPVAAKLVEARSPAAGVVEIHSMTMRDGVMEMRRMEALVLPAKQTIRLAPGGYHIMLIDLKKPLKAGEKVPLTLTVERVDGARSQIRVTAVVKDAADERKPADGMKGMEGMGDMGGHQP